MVISAEALDKVQLFFFPDNSPEENKNISQIPQLIHDKNYSQHCINLLGGDNERISSEIKNDTRLLTLPTVTEYSA